jgi:Txe/YoeB family toxin of toxin-antitoxin system
VEIVFTNQAEKDFERVKQHPVLLKKVVALLDLVEENPFATPPRYEKLIGLKNVYSRRINQQHRFIYEFIEATKRVKVIHLSTYYEKVKA